LPDHGSGLPPKAGVYRVRGLRGTRPIRHTPRRSVNAATPHRCYAPCRPPRPPPVREKPRS
jgi:hypothetical protein